MKIASFPLQRYNRIKPEDRRAFLDKLLAGYAPATQPSVAALKVVTFGSCFAQNLHKALCARGVVSQYAGFSEEVNSPLFNEVFIKELVLGEASDRHALYVELARHEWKTDADPGALVAAMRVANTFVLTLGLGQLWVRRSDGKMVLAPDFNRIEEYSTALLYPQPQAHSILEILRMLRQINETANVILTVSPVPLQLSMTHPSVVVSDCVSKSILRVAVQLVLDKKPSDVHYFPSFEFFRWYSGHVAEAAFGQDGNPRHPSPDYVELLIEAFLSRMAAPEKA